MTHTISTDLDHHASSPAHHVSVSVVIPCSLLGAESESR